MGTEGQSVLVVDPDFDTLWELGRLLTREGLLVATCADLPEAVSLIESRDFRVVITDIGAPGSEGLSLIDWIRANKPFVVVAAITKRGSPVLKDIALSKGAVLYLEKPVDRGVLLEAVQASIRREAFQGTIDSIDILDYVQLIMLSGKQLVLEVVATDGRRGELFIEGGQIRHAVCGNLEGEPAAYACLTFAGGRFVNRPWRVPEKVTICKPGDFILIESARIKDELGEFRYNQTAD